MSVCLLHCPDPIFGADLAKFCERTRTNIPQFLVHFMEHIEKHGLDIVGLYRLSGNAASVQKLRCLVEQGTHTHTYTVRVYMYI